MKQKIILPLIAVTVLCGCQSLPNGGFSVPSQPIEKEKYLYSNGAPKLGIAISGGGLRSASFSYGALKRLYDQGILQQANLISSVSGGGYTGYEIFVNELYKSDVSEPFGSNTFSKENFSQRLYHHYYTANFVTNGQILKSFLSEWPKALYRRRIIEKYGVNEARDLLNMEDLASPALNGRVPYYIVNTTLKRPKPNFSISEIYEFTPLVAGNLERGFNPYEQYQSPELSTAIAISGAAFSPLLGYKLLDPTTFSDTEMKLSDGGHSENLGAFSLIRRGVENIIILDGEQDPGYEFGAYTKLQERLCEWGDAKIVVPEIELIIADDAKKERIRLSQGGRLRSPLMHGKVLDAQGKIISNVFYLKMANSEVADAEYSPKDVIDGESATHAVRNILKQSSDIDGNWQSSKLIDVSVPHKEVFAYHLNKYPEILESRWKVKAINALRISFTKLNFPHYSTADQSYFNNQFLAYVALGYFSSRDFASIKELSETN